MKLEIYLCDNCNKSINEKEKYSYGLYYLYLCENCKKKYDKFSKKWKENENKFLNNYYKEMDNKFPNLYKKVGVDYGRS